MTYVIEHRKLRSNISEIKKVITDFQKLKITSNTIHPSDMIKHAD